MSSSWENKNLVITKYENFSSGKKFMWGWLIFSGKKCWVLGFVKNNAHFLFTGGGPRNLACREGLLQASGCDGPGMKPSEKRGDTECGCGARRGTATFVSFQACFCHFPLPLSLPDFTMCHTSVVFIFYCPKEPFFTSFSSTSSIVKIWP